MNRVTAPEVRGMFERTVRAAQSVGLDTHSWFLMPGSAVNGRAWRLFSRPGGGTALEGLDRGFLGMTAREARDTLQSLAVAWEAVAGLVRGCEVCGRDDLATMTPPRCPRHTDDDPTGQRVRAQLLGELGETNSG